MDMCGSFASAGSNATSPVIFEPMAMSIPLLQQERINKLEKKLDENAKRTNELAL
jgi:hypothetical protein